jgi:putative hydrolase of the HAD superfamily
VGTIRAVLFDAGATLIDPVEPVERTYCRRARHFHPDLDEAAFLARFRSEWSRLRKDYRSNHPELETSEEMEREAWHRFTWQVARPFERLASFHESWLSTLVDEFDHGAAWQVLPGVRETLRELRRQGNRLGVVSNWHGVLGQILAHHGLGSMLDLVLTSAEAGRKKPHPAIFRSALDRLEVRAPEVLHVGDSWEEDTLGALAVGIRPIHLDREPDPNRYCLETAPTVPVIRSIGEVVPILEKMVDPKSEKDPSC